MKPTSTFRVEASQKRIGAAIVADSCDVAICGGIDCGYSIDGALGVFEGGYKPT